MGESATCPDLREVVDDGAGLDDDAPAMLDDGDFGNGARSPRLAGARMVSGSRLKTSNS